jgi:mono/diheme cytochrome c family protein
MRKIPILVVLAIALACATSWVAAQQRGDAAPASPSGPAANSGPASPDTSGAKPAATAHPAPVRSATEDRIEGEKRFRANCARCHQSPHKFSPRAMATIIRHMRVRATLTDEDARLILKYMTQ